MVDIHCHILPQLDDGAIDVETSVEMLKSAIKDNITTIVATPHFNVDNMTISTFLAKRKASFDKLSAVMSNLPECPKILMGAEVEASYDLPTFPDVHDLCIEGTNYMLLEIPHLGYPEWMDTLVFNLQARCGIIPIIAHPERNPWIQEKPKRLYKLCLAGVLSQVDVHDISDKRGTASVVKTLLRHNLIHFLASDAHNNTTRPLNISNYLSPFVDEKTRKDYSHELLKNSENLIANGTFTPRREPIEFKSSSSKSSKNPFLRKFSIKLTKDKKKS